MRRFLCLVLVACLIFSVFALPASAIAFSAGTVVSVAAAALIPAMIVGLGLFPESSDAGYEAFSQLCANVDTMLTDAGQAIDDRIDVIRYGGINYVSSAMLQTVKDWFFSSGSLTYNYEKIESNEGTFTANGEEIQFSVPSGGVIIHRFYHRYSQWRTDVYNETLVSVIGTPSFSGYINSYSSPNTDYVTYLFRQDVPESEAVGTFVSGTFTNAHDLWYYRVLPQLIDLTPPVSTGTGITFGSVKPLPDVDIATNYIAWSSTQFEPDVSNPEDPTEPAVPYFPIYIPDILYTDSLVGYPDQIAIQNPSVIQDTEDTDETQPSVPVVPDVGDGDITTSVSSILTVVHSILTSLVEFKDAALDWIQVAWAAFVAGLMDTLTSIKDAIIAIPGVIVGAIEALAATVTSIWEWLQEVFGLTIQQILEILTSIQAWALGLVDALILALSDLLTKIFAVDVAAVQAAVADLRAEFPFFDSIIATGEFLYNGITSGEPPVIYAYLQNAEGRYNWGTTVAVLDMSFYSRYKATGDAIMSAALYAFFGWRTFVRLPGIISGAGSDIKEVTNHYDI